MKHTFKKLVSVAITAVIAFSFMTTAFAAYYGDLNGDGNVNSTDALLVLKYSVGAVAEIDSKIADVNSDGKVNSTDALAILRISVGQGQPEEIPEEKPSAPSSMEEIVEFYNNAVNKVIDEKAGYTKQRTTTVSEMNGGALLKIQLVVDMINEFLGVGTTEYLNAKGNANYLSKASLAKTDIKSATCEQIGETYTVTLNLTDGNSSATASSKKDSSALARSGLLTGDVASPDYDYLSSGCIYESIRGVEDVSVKSIKATNTNVKIVAVVDTEGKLLSLTASYDWTIEMDTIKYTVVSVKKANGKAHTAVVISDFKW